MCNLFNFAAPADTTAAVQVVEQPAVSQEAQYLAAGQTGPMVRINALVANALFDPEGPGYTGENWVLIPSMPSSRFVIVNTDQSPRPNDITHPNGWRVFFRKYVGDTGVVPYTESAATKKAIGAICAAGSEDEIKSVVLGLGSTAVVDAAMLGIAAGFRCVELAQAAIDPVVDREVVADLAANASTTVNVVPKVVPETTPVNTPADANTNIAPVDAPTTSATMDAPAPNITLALVQAMIGEAVRENKTLAKHANEAARIYTTTVVDDVVATMLEALISMGDRNRLRKLVRATPITEAVTEVTT